MKKSRIGVMGVPPPSVERPSVTVFNHFTDPEEMAIARMEVFAVYLRLNGQELNWPVKRDLILYFAYCIGLTLIGLLMAIGWRDFFAASRASTVVSRICLDCFRK
jgi:hypothetical protein